MELTNEDKPMKKRLFLLLPIFALCSCSGDNYGKEVSIYEAQQVYSNISATSNSIVNYVINCTTKLETTYLDGSNVKEVEESAVLLEVTKDGYFHFKTTEKASENGSSGMAATSDFYFGRVGNKDISYSKYTLGGVTLFEEAEEGISNMPDGLTDFVKQYGNYLDLVSYDFYTFYELAMSDVLNPQARYYSKDSGSFAIVVTTASQSGNTNQGQTPFGPMPSSSGSGDKKEVVFENGRFKKMTSKTSTTEAGYMKYSSSLTLSYSYPTNLTINVPSAYKNAMDNGW